jgi:hypothetical protein
MLRRTAILGLIALAALAVAAEVNAAPRTVLAEMFGGTWCGYCPTAQAALTILEEQCASDRCFPVYYHVGPDPYATPETNARAGYYGVGGVPHVRFAGALKAVGVFATAEQTANWYAAKIDSALAMPAPITIDSQGAIGENGNGWVTAHIEAVEPVSYTHLRVQFVLYENGLRYGNRDYDWTARDQLAPEEITLAGAGDFVEVTRNFTFDPAVWDPASVRLAVFVEDYSLKEVVNAQIMRDPYEVDLITENYADEIDYWGESTFVTVLKNAGTLTDTITTDIAQLELPEGVDEWQWFAIYCDTDGICYFGPHDWVMAPGEEETLLVHVSDYNGTVQGRAVTELTATSVHHRETMASEIFGTFVDLPSVLTVDDDDGDTLEVYLSSALADTGYPSMVWDTTARGRPSPELLESFWAVFWTTGGGSASYIGPYDEQSMTDYLDGGGNLFLASMEYLSSRVLTPLLVSDYLHIDSWSDDVGGFAVSGVSGDIITDGMSLGLSDGPVPTSGIDSIVLGAGSTEIFSSMSSTKGLRVEEDEHKVVFTSFPFEDIKVVNPAPSNQRALVRRIVDYFMIETGVEEGLDPEIAGFALGQNVPNPFNPMTTVRFSVPSGTERVRLAVHSVDGRLVRTLVDGGVGPGVHFRVWDGKNDRGDAVASGIYFMRLEADDQVETRKMTLLK